MAALAEKQTSTVALTTVCWPFCCPVVDLHHDLATLAGRRNCRSRYLG